MVYFDGAMALSGVSCPSVRFCAAVDDGGDVVVSSKPSSHVWSAVRLDRWSVVSVDRKGGLSGISCASASLCVAFDPTRLFVSTDPASGAASWRAVRVEPQPSACKPDCPRPGL
jgi:hypothetical protein